MWWMCGISAGRKVCESICFSLRLCEGTVIIMRFFNCKLYQQFYPCITDENVKSFLDTFTHLDLIKILHWQVTELEVALTKLRNSYRRQLQPYYGLFGNNPENIFHNELILEKMHQDKNIEQIDKKLYETYRLLNSAQVGDKLSADDVNYILQCMNAKYQYNVGVNFAACTIFLLLVIYFIVF